MKTKRGMSAVITTLIIILLVLFAIGILWSIIANLLKDTSEQISIDRFTVDVTIKEVDVYDDMNRIDITILRNPGRGDISGLVFIFSNSTNSERFVNDTTLDELATSVYSFFPDMNVSEIDSIEVYPIIEEDIGDRGDECSLIGGEWICSDEDGIFSSSSSSSGGGGCGDNGDPCDDGDVCTFDDVCSSGVCSGTSLGVSCNDLIAWWRFEGDFTDETGNYNGINFGDVQTILDPSGTRPGQIAIFDGAGDYLNLAQQLYLADNDDWTIMYFFNQTEIERGTIGSSEDICNRLTHTNFVQFTVYNNYCESVTFNRPNVEGEWHHGTWIAREDNFALFYLDGVLEGEPGDLQINSLKITNIGRVFSDTSHDWEGSLDEIMVWNRTLSQGEITQLRNVLS